MIRPASLLRSAAAVVLVASPAAALPPGPFLPGSELPAQNAPIYCAADNPGRCITWRTEFFGVVSPFGDGDWGAYNLFIRNLSGSPGTPEQYGIELIDIVARNNRTIIDLRGGPALLPGLTFGSSWQIGAMGPVYRPDDERAADWGWEDFPGTVIQWGRFWGGAPATSASILGCGQIPFTSVAGVAMGGTCPSLGYTGEVAMSLLIGHRAELTPHGPSPATPGSLDDVSILIAGTDCVFGPNPFPSVRVSACVPTGATLDVSAVTAPEPATLVLTTSGLLTLAGLARRRGSGLTASAPSILDATSALPEVSPDNSDRGTWSGC